MIFTASGDRRSVAPLPTEADLEAATPTTLRYSSDVNDHRFSNKRFSQLSRFSQLTTPWDTPRQTQDFSEKHREQVLRDQYRNSTATASSTNTERHAESKGRLSPTSRWTPHQLFYVFGLDGIGAMFISGGVNFAIAYAMYVTQNIEKHPIRLFQLPNTLAGDAAVTIIIQCILTWFVEWGLVSHDISNKGVAPVGFLREPSHFLLRWFFFLTPIESKLPRWMSGKTDEEETQKNWQRLFGVIVQHALRGFLFAVVGFLLLWPVSVGALTAFGMKQGGDYIYGKRWTPQVFKLVLGGVLGLLTTPLMALFWLAKAGWEA